MQINTVLEENSKAIRLLDSGMPHLAGKIFRQNYRLSPSPMTAINYANFLLDEHYLPSPSAAATLLYSYRCVHSKHILRKIKKDQRISLLISYHLACINGHAQLLTNNYKKAKEYYKEAYRVNSTSVEALTMLAWISFLEKQYGLLHQYLDELTGVLQLGSDIEQNLDIIFDNCPFVFFPYYQLRIISYSETNEIEKASTLLERMQMLSINGDLFSVSDIVLLSIYLNEFQNIDSVWEHFIQSNDKSKNEICFILFKLKSLLFSCNNLRKYYYQLKISTSILDRIWFRVKTCIYSPSIQDTIIHNYRVNVSYKECHFIGCPIHNQKGEDS